MRDPPRCEPAADCGCSPHGQQPAANRTITVAIELYTNRESIDGRLLEPSALATTFRGWLSLAAVIDSAQRQPTYAHAHPLTHLTTREIRPPTIANAEEVPPMRNIVHIMLRRQASPGRPRAVRGSVAAAATCAAMLSLCLPGNAALAAARSLPVGHCRLVLRLTMAPTRRNQAVSAYKSSSGTASCTGTLGPWLMGDETGWSGSDGTLKNVTPNIANRQARVSTNGTGAFWAVAPRLAWFHPPMVTLTGAFHLHRTGNVIDLNGTGRLIPTREAPVASAFTFAGTATLTLNHRRVGRVSHTTGTMTIQFDVHQNP